MYRAYPLDIPRLVDRGAAGQKESSARGSWAEMLSASHALLCCVRLQCSAVRQREERKVVAPWPVPGLGCEWT